MRYGIFERIGCTTINGKVVDLVGRRIWEGAEFRSVAGAYAAWFDAGMGNSNTITVEALPTREEEEERAREPLLDAMVEKIDSLRHSQGIPDDWPF